MEYKYIIFANCISQMKCLVEAGVRLGIDVANIANKVLTMFNWPKSCQSHNESHKKSRNIALVAE